MEKKSVPVILLHGWGGQRGEFDGLALKLQEKGHAVIAPDLRGHGESTVQRGPTADDEKELDYEKFSKQDVINMVFYDMEAIVDFLLGENNREKLNIDALCGLGTDMSTVVLLNWSVVNWNKQPLTIGRQGQWIKAIVLLSPVQSYQGLTIRDFTTHPRVRRDISLMVIAGKKDSKSYSGAKRLHTSLKRYHQADKSEGIEKQDLFAKYLETNLRGTKLLGKPSLKVDPLIAAFITYRLTKRMEDYFPWEERYRP